LLAGSSSELSLESELSGFFDDDLARGTEVDLDSWDETAGLATTAGLTKNSNTKLNK
jgi:hypothetical protein